MGKAHPGRVGRRLAAIVAADVAGYSRLMGLDEVGTARTLRVPGYLESGGYCARSVVVHRRPCRRLGNVPPAGNTPSDNEQELP